MCNLRRNFSDADRVRHSWLHGCRIGADGIAGQKIDNLPQCLERTELFRFDFGRTWQLRCKRSHDFNALDRVDAQIGIHAHVEVQHLDRISGLVGDNCKQGCADEFGPCRRTVRPDTCCMIHRRPNGSFLRRVCRGVASVEKGDNLLQCLQRTQVLGFDFRCIRQQAAHGCHDFNPLDRVDSKIRIHAHVEGQHFDGVTGLVCNNFEHR